MMNGAASLGMAAPTPAPAPAQPAPVMEPHVQPMAHAAAQAGLGAAQQQDQFTAQMAILNKQLDAQEAGLSKSDKAPPMPKTQTAQTVEAQNAPAKGDTVQQVTHAIGAILPSIMGAVLASSSGGAGAAMGSMFALHGYYTALNEGRLQDAKIQGAKTEELMKEAQMQNQVSFDKYNAILKHQQMDMQQKLIALKTTAMQLHDVQMEQAANEGDLLKIANLNLNREKANNELKMQGERLSATIAHDNTMAGMAAQRVGIAKERMAKEGGGKNTGVTYKDVIDMADQENSLAKEKYLKELTAYPGLVQAYGIADAAGKAKMGAPVKPTPPPAVNYEAWFHKYGLQTPAAMEKSVAPAAPAVAPLPYTGAENMKPGVPYEAINQKTGQKTVLIKNADGQVTEHAQ